MLVASSRKSKSDRTGLVATGSCGSWSVDIDETLTGERKWFAQIEGPSLYLSIEISSPQLVDAMLRYLGAPAETGESGGNGADGWLLLGKFDQSSVALIRDSETTSRCFLKIGDGTPCLRIALSGEDIAMPKTALGQVRKELLADGLLKMPPPRNRAKKAGKQVT